MKTTKFKMTRDPEMPTRISIAPVADKWERGYHQGEIVERSTMAMVAKFVDDSDRDAVIKMHNEHAALVAVAEEADLVGKANMRLLEAQRQGDKTAIGNATIDLWSKLDRLADRLAAVRDGSGVVE